MKRKWENFQSFIVRLAFEASSRRLAKSMRYHLLKLDHLVLGFCCALNNNYRGGSGGLL